MSTEVTAPNPSEFHSDQHRESMLTALENEYKNLEREALIALRDGKDAFEADLRRRQNEVDAELKRIRGEGFPGHEDRLAAPAKQTRAAS
jgi:hypothetical protein